MSLKTIKKIRDLGGKRVLMRVDFNFSLKKGVPVDDFRLKAILPTFEYLRPFKPKLILISHLGRPNGRFDKKYSLEPVSRWLRRQSNIFKNLKFIDNPFSKEGREKIESLKAGEIALLENIRFWPEEERNDKEFAKKLAKFGDIYINEAFSVSHRAHSSIVGLAKNLPSYAGIRLACEVKAMKAVLQNPYHPFILILGGAKISTKLGLLKYLKSRADFILIGGAIANTFFRAQGFNVGQSYLEKSMVEATRVILRNKNLVLPKDVVIKRRNRDIKVVQVSQLDSLRDRNFEILDIGPETIKTFSAFIKKGRQIIWNGPLGYFEEKRFCKGTKAITKAILSRKARIVIGGGETVACLKQANPKFKILNSQANIFVSTGGGAMLEFLSGKTLPGLKVLYAKFR